jgi:hypothetical protein
MVDISSGGLGATTDRAFYPGQRVILSLPLTERGSYRNVYATIVQCRTEAGGFRVGLEFDNVAVGAWGGVSYVMAAA